MTDLRARLAEVLTMMARREVSYEEMMATVDAMAELLARPALARALEDAERVPALDARIAELEAENARLRDALAISRAQFSDLQTLVKISGETNAAAAAGSE